ncbi:MAG: hypothetical protein NZ811_06730 [Gammaproteobacteria bacterium]|nr:hypothetical protein [Gammaproteobacteria bacterium]
MQTLNKYNLIGSLVATTLLSGFLANMALFSSSAYAGEGVGTDNGATTAAGNTDNNINEDDEITLGFNQPQSLSVSSPNNEVNRAADGTINRTWQIVSNNAVAVRFTGKSPNATGTSTDAPTFYKAEVDANGDKIASGDDYQYDHLVTTYGVEIANQHSVAGTSGAWKGGSTPAGEPQHLVTARNTDNSPGKHFDSIMPNDNGQFKMTLSAKGVGDVATTQSGDYQVTIVASFIAEEKGNGTITANSPDFLTALQSYNSVESPAANSGDNSVWQTTGTTGIVANNLTGGATTGGAKLSAQDLSNDNSYTNAANN